MAVQGVEDQGLRVSKDRLGISDYEERPDLAPLPTLAGDLDGERHRPLQNPRVYLAPLRADLLEQLRSTFHRSYPPSVLRFSIGRRTAKRVSPGSESKMISPPSPATMRRTMSSPSPVPSPISLVVKNGSKTRFWISRGMPGPPSTISTTTRPFSRNALTTICPRPSTAS